MEQYSKSRNMTPGAPAVQVLDALHLSRQTFSKIRQNLCWAFAYNVIALPLAAGVFLPAFGVALTPSISGENTTRSHEVSWCPEHGALQMLPEQMMSNMSGLQVL